MPLDDVNDEDAQSDEPKIECSMCHQLVVLSHSVAMSGRRLCFGCAAAWFDDEDEHEGDS